MISRILITTLLLFHSCKSNKLQIEDLAREFMEKINKELADQENRVASIQWDSETTGGSPEIIEALINIMQESLRLFKENYDEAISYPWQSFEDANLKRQFQLFTSSSADGADLPVKTEQLMQIGTEIAITRSTAKICSYSNKKKCDLQEADIKKILMTSNTVEELKYTWLEWQDASGKRLKELFPRLVDAANQAAVQSNLTDFTEVFLLPYEDKNFRNVLQKLWMQLRPLYLQFHAYIRGKLRSKFDKEAISRDGYIPAHLVGHINSMIPYPNAKKTDCTDTMVAQKYTPEQIFKIAENFFKSINMSAMPKEFWKKSILKKPKGSHMDCETRSMNFQNGDDFRIKQCTVVNSENFEIAHREMGTIQYFLQYKHLPYLLRGAANPGFEEALKDTISLSVSTDKYLNKIGLLKKYADNKEATINKLFEMGLKNIMLIPSAYIIELWRSDVFGGKIAPDTYNSEWWKLKKEYEGTESPVQRSKDDFDPGSIEAIGTNMPYYKYFVSNIIQFQFHKALCEKAGEYEAGNSQKALHNYDIYLSKEAGNALAKMLRLGRSKPWQDAMETLTGGRNMDTSALLEYFKPLQEWLEIQNKKSGEYIGWKAK